MEYFSHFNLFGLLKKMGPLLAQSNWSLGNNFLVEVVTKALLFSGVTAFSSLSADLESRLKPPSGFGPLSDILSGL